MKMDAAERDLAEKLARFLRTRSPIAKAIQRARTGMWKCFVFGGVLRDVFRPDPLAPGIRDVDLVINDEDFDTFHWHLRAFVVARNRFGGLRLKIGQVPIDAWSLSQTWAFRQGYVLPKSFRSLAETTFLNIDGIVADVSYFHRNRVEVYAQSYLRAFENNVLDIELRANPFPPLVAVKALRAMYRYHLNINRPLAAYISDVIEGLGVERFEREQRRHYGRAIISGDALRAFATSLESYLRHSEDEVYSLYGQRYLPGFKKTLSRQSLLPRNLYNYAA